MNAPIHCSPGFNERWTIAPMLCTKITPVPEACSTNRPSPETINACQDAERGKIKHYSQSALPKLCALCARVTPCVHARKECLLKFHVVVPSRRMGTTSPQVSGARRTSPGPVMYDSASSEFVMSFLKLIFSCTVCQKCCHIQR